MPSCREIGSPSYQAKTLYQHEKQHLVLGNYVILDKLGQGGMGMVLKARHRRMQRVVALKVLTQEIVDDERAIQRFHREVVAAARLAHPNIVTAYDADEAKGTHFLVMEYVEGCDLSKIVKSGGPLAVETAVAYVMQAARGLEYAHQHGVVHRDIKPSNLLLDSHEAVKILDMGLARVDSLAEDGPQAELTGSGAILGTIDYMAPEQAMNTKDADARSDVYSLGAALWSLLTSRPMYPGESIVVKLLAHRESPIPSLCEARQDVPPALDATFRKMVAKQSRDRFQSMTEVLEALGNSLPGSAAKNLPSQPVVSSEDAKLAEFFRSQPSGTKGFGATQFAPLGATIAQLPQQSPAEMQTTVAMDQQQADTDPKTEQSLQFAAAQTAAASPTKPQPVRGKSRSSILQKYPLATVGSVVVVGVAVVLATVMTLISAGQGTVRIEIADPSIEILVLPVQAVVQGEGKQLSLWPGKYSLRVKRGEVEFETDTFTIFKGENPAVSVLVLPDQIKVVQDSAAIGRMPLRGAAAMAKEKNYALLFDGKSNYVDIPSLVYDGKSSITLEAMVVAEQGSEEFASIVGNETVLGSALLRIRNDSGQVEFIHWLQKEAKFLAAPMPRGQRIHIAGAWDGKEMRLFVNGRKIDGAVTNVTFDFSNPLAPFVIGGSRNEITKEIGRWHLGVIDEVRISNKARYTKNFAPEPRLEPDADTLALYHFDEGKGDVLTDASDNKHHGKIHGATWVKTSEAVKQTQELAAKIAQEQRQKEEEARQKEADAAFPALAAKAQEAGTDFASFSREAQAFKAKFGGTSSAIQAAELLMKFPSPLDKLDRAKLPEDCVEFYRLQGSEPVKELVGVLGEHRQRHWGGVGPIAYSPDGKRVASGQFGEVHVWDGETLRRLAILKGSGGEVFALAFSPDSKKLAFSNGSGPVSIWDISGNELRELQSLAGHGNNTFSIVFSPDGKSLAYASSDKSIWLWDVSGEKPHLTRALKDVPQPPQTVLFTPNSKTLVYHSGADAVYFWNWEAGETVPPTALKLPDQQIWSVAISPNGNYLATTCASGQGSLWDLREKPLKRRALLESGAARVAFAPDGETLAIGDSGGNIQLWDMTSAVPAQRSILTGHSQLVHTVRFGPDSKTLASISNDGVSKVWNLETHKERFAVKGQIACFAPDSQRLITTAGSALRLWDVATGDEIRPITGHTAASPSIAFSPDCRRLLTACWDGTARLWDVSKRADPQVFDLGQRTTDCPVTFSPDGEMIALGAADRVQLWDLKKSELRHSLPCLALDISFSPDGQTLATAEGSIMACLWEVATGHRQFTLTSPNAYCAAFDPSGKTIFTADDDKAIHIFSSREGRELDRYDPQFGTAPRAIAFNPDGKKILAMGGGTPLRCWEVKDWRQLWEQPGGPFAISPDGQRVVIASGDKITLNDASSGEPLQEWQFPGPVHDVAFASDGRHIGTANANGTVYILRLMTPSGQAAQ